MRIILIFFISAYSLISWSEKNDAYILSHQEALMGITQISGFFDRNISLDASLDDVTYLLSYYGITVNVLKIWNNDPFTEKDMAKILAQIYILHRGEVQQQHAQIGLPSGYDHWIEFCEIHGLDYQVVYQSLADFFLMEKDGDKDE